MRPTQVAAGLALLACALLAGCLTPSQPARTSRDTWDLIQIGAVEVGEVREERNEDGEAWAHYTISVILTNEDSVDHDVVLEVEEDQQKQGRYDCGNGIREGCDSMFINKVPCTVPARSTEVCEFENSCYWNRFGGCRIVEFMPGVESTEIVEIDGVSREAALAWDRDAPKRSKGFWARLRDGLDEGWWQGVAGLAQIIAAGLAVWTVIQARKTIDQANEERRFSVRPDWDLVVADYPKRPLGRGTPSVRVRLDLMNTGFGPARQPSVHFQSRNGNEPFGLGFIQSDSNVIPAGGTLQIGFGVNKGEPLDGELLIKSTSRFDELISCRFIVLTNDFEEYQHMDKPCVERIGCD